MDRSQFTFYRSFWDAVKRLKRKDDRLSALEAICAYALDGETRSMTDAAEAIFVLIQPVLDTAARKAETGRNGGSRPRANGKQTESKPEAESEQTEREKEKEIEEEIEIEIEKEKESYISPPLPPQPVKPAFFQQAGSKPSFNIADDEGFETFWSAYPMKRGDIREACRLYLHAIDGGATLQEMLDALDWQKKQTAWTDQGGRYIPSAEKWLANKAWTQKPIKDPPQGEKDAPEKDYGKPNADEMERMKRFLDKLGGKT